MRANHVSRVLWDYDGRHVVADAPTPALAVAMVRAVMELADRGTEQGEMD